MFLRDEGLAAGEPVTMALQTRGTWIEVRRVV